MAAIRGTEVTPKTARLKSACPARKKAGPPRMTAAAVSRARPPGWLMTSSSPTAAAMIPATIGRWK
jgi:hypothetical protein